MKRFSLIVLKLVLHNDSLIKRGNGEASEIIEGDWHIGCEPTDSVNFSLETACLDVLLTIYIKYFLSFRAKQQLGPHLKLDILDLFDVDIHPEEDALLNLVLLTLMKRDHDSGIVAFFGIVDEGLVKLFAV